MSDWVKVANVGEIPPGGSKLADVDGGMVLVCNVDGEYHAIDDMCTHDGGTLSGGTVQGEEIICPRHAARFNIRTGEVTAPPAFEPVHVFPLRIRGEAIEVRDDRWE
jgi:3-phenylpropionate/trans-cinnamate dioxygenase ferredoxin component